MTDDHKVGCILIIAATVFVILLGLALWYGVFSTT
jgi:hypothetical protein